MRLVQGMSFSTVVLSALLMPAVGTAAPWTHSWCVPGAPLTSPAPTGTDANLVTIFNVVCASSPNCCSSSGHWGLACVQAAANLAKQNNLTVSGKSDYCGRYAWAQGPIANTQQYYPRDFSLFTLGDATGLADVAGPVAAQGNVTASSFFLNGIQQDPVALVAQGTIALKVGGTVNGRVYYSSTSKTAFSDTPSVNYVNAARPTAATNPSPIDFANASKALLSMSQQLNLYTPSGTTTHGNNAITFAGSDTELNVFQFSSSWLSGITVFNFQVPPNSAVIINVTGDTATFASAGYSSIANLHLQSVLWNFPSATQLKLSSTSIPGSILAPQAAATLGTGSLVGTVVAKSAALSFGEFDWNPYQVPSATGFLPYSTLTPGDWSCSKDTAVDDTGQNAAVIKAEAGFLDIPLDNYQAEGESRTSHEHRIWYAFQPATYNSKYRPLAVFFNGGPGSATSSGLFSFNTANMTLDPAEQTNGSTIASNPNRWTQFANLLYIDAPATGFSYPLSYTTASGSVVTPFIGIDLSRDAGIFLQVLTRFLVRHPALLGNPVILVAESYGGTRATLMLHYLYNYSVTDPAFQYQDAQLVADLNAYFFVAFATTKPDPIRQIAKIFHYQVLIEPAVVGSKQVIYAAAKEPQDPNCIASDNPNYLCSVTSGPTMATCDVNSCDQLPLWTQNQLDAAGANLNHPATLQAALGVDPTTIAWMKADYRKAAYGRNGGDPCGNGTTSGENSFSTLDMQNAFGTFPSTSRDCYFIVLNDAVNEGYDGSSASWEDAGDTIGYYFLENAANVATFITVDRYDQNIWTPAIPLSLYCLANPQASNCLPGSSVDPDIANLISSAAYDPTYSTGLARAGAMLITYKSSPTSMPFAMPTSYIAGHVVTMGGHSIPSGRNPGFSEVLADVRQWYAAH